MPVNELGKSLLGNIPMVPKNHPTNYLLIAKGEITVTTETPDTHHLNQLTKLSIISNESF